MLLITRRVGVAGTEASSSRATLLPPPKADLLEYRMYSQAQGNKARFRWHCPPQAELLPTQGSGQFRL